MLVCLLMTALAAVPAELEAIQQRLDSVQHPGAFGSCEEWQDTGELRLYLRLDWNPDNRDRPRPDDSRMGPYAETVDVYRKWCPPFEGPDVLLIHSSKGVGGTVKTRVLFDTTGRPQVVTHTADQRQLTAYFDGDRVLRVIRTVKSEESVVDSPKGADVTDAEKLRRFAVQLAAYASPPPARDKISP